MQMNILSEWIVIDGYCAARVLINTDPSKLQNRIAFIEKSPRIRLHPFNPVNDSKNWKFGIGSSEYGFDLDSRKWCDNELIKLGYFLK